MQTLDLDRTVSEMLRERPARSRVFERFGINYCCGGKLPLKEACEKRHVPAEEVLAALAASDAKAPADEGFDLAAMPLDALAAHIVATHHAYLAEELPRLAAMASRVAKVHGGSDPRLVALDETLQGVIMELQAHMDKEEHVLFPVIREMAVTNTMHAARFGSIANPIQMMEREHDDAAGGLSRMHELTDGFSPPDWACGTYRALLDGLAALEADLHQHVHKENNILFPRALELEDRLRQAAS